MLKIGITGGIGSGKTTVCRLFEQLGIPIYYADDRAKMLMRTKQPLIEGIKKVFGEEAYLEDGNLNRAHIAQIAFNDKAKLAQLNGLVHPAVWEDGQEWNDAQKNVPYTLKEAALMFEGGSYLALDKVITVYAPKDIRLERVMKRDNSSQADVEARMDKQMPEEEKLKLADFVIYNDGEQLLIPQVMKIHQAIVQLLGS